MTVIAPERSYAQRIECLQLANRTRIHMKDRRIALAAGEITLDVLLDDPLCGSMYVARAVRAVPAIGVRKTDLVLAKAGISPSARIGRLTDRQRTALLAHVAYYPVARKALS